MKLGILFACDDRNEICWRCLSSFSFCLVFSYAMLCVLVVSMSRSCLHNQLFSWKWPVMVCILSRFWSFWNGYLLCKQESGWVSYWHFYYYYQVSVQRCTGTLHIQFSSVKPDIIKLVKCGLKKECFKLLAEHPQRWCLCLEALLVPVGCAQQGLWNNTVSVCLPICLSQHDPTAANPLLQVCCCGPSRQQISIDFCSSGWRMLAMPCCQHA